MIDATEISPAQPGPPPPDTLVELGPATPTWTWQRVAFILLLYVLSIAAAFALSALLVAVTGGSPSSVFTAMYNGSLRDGAAIGLTLDEAAPVLVVALGTVICTRAGIFNIGQEGQLIFGATIGAAVGLGVPGPGPFVLFLTIVGAAAGGALWAGISALLKYWRGVDVVISTLLMNFLAFEVVSFAVNRNWLLRESVGRGQLSVPESDQLPANTRLPRLGEFPHFNVGLGIFIAVGCALLLAVLLDRTRWGFHIRMLGMNPVAARRAGVSAVVIGGGALVLSGAFAGLAGGVMLAGSVFRIQGGFSNNVGFEGLLAALVARRRPLLCIPVALFFGMLRSGGGFLASTGVPRYLVDIVQALLVLATVFPPVFMELLARRKSLAVARAGLQVSG